MTTVDTERECLPRFTERMRDAVAAWGPLVPLLVFLAVLMLVPVVQLLLLSVQTKDGGFTLQNYQRLFATGVYLQVLLITFKIAGWTTLFAVLFSYPVAYLIATSEDKLRARLVVWVLLPFWTSFLVRTFAWLVLLGRNGAINDLLQTLGATDEPLGLIYTLPSVLVGMTHALMPLCILTMVSVMENIDQNLAKAALTMGARPGTAFWRVYFPLSLPGVTAGALLVFITALGFFITPAFLGGRRETMITQIIIQQVTEILNWGFAGAVALLLFVTAMVVFFLYDRIVGLSSLAGGGQRTEAGPGSVVSGRLERLRIAALGLLGRATDLVAMPFERIAAVGGLPATPGRIVLWTVVLAMLLFLTAPAFLMVPMSFTERPIIDWPPKGFSLDWYAAYWQSAQWMAATARSFVVASLTAVAATAIGTPAAFVLARRRFFGKGLVLGFVLSPLIIPRVIIAVALFYLYARLGLVGTELGLVIGHTILGAPYVVITVMAALKTYDDRFDLAAASLGANRWRTLTRVTFPILRAGLIAAFLFAFITSFDELTIALFVTGGLTTTLPKQMWDDGLLRITPTLAAVSTLLLVFITAVILATDRLQRRTRRAE
jgi:putative spermidine/putrescine transport system permease protein